MSKIGWGLLGFFLVMAGTTLAFPGFIVLPVLLRDAGFGPRTSALGLLFALVFGLVLVVVGAMCIKKLPDK